MKNLFLAIILLCSAAATTQAQVSFGLKGGLATRLDHPDELLVQHGETGYSLKPEEQKFGTQFGAYLRIGKRIFVQPEVTFNSSRTDYQFKGTDAKEMLLHESYKNLDIPVLVGLAVGPIRLQAGPVGHYFLGSKSDLTDVDGYDEKFKDLTFGWQAGIGIGKGRLGLDVRYEGNFNKAGDHINFFGQSYNFSTNPARLVVGLNVKLF